MDYTLFRSTINRCRTLLETSVSELLQGQFGIRADGFVEDATRMSHLSREDTEYREQILDHLAHLRSHQVSPAMAVAQLVREASFTHLNRICAYKMMEERGAIREAVGRGPSSDGFKLYLAEHEDDYRLWLEGQEDTAYRRFLLWQGACLQEELGSLFSSHDAANRLFPPHRVLLEVLDLINDKDLQPIWGEDETIGWFYQYFTPKELREQARKESSAPRDSYELAFRNQFYTPRYVVRFLVDNSLGRLWWDMTGGETRLIQTCQFLNPLREPVEKTTKKDPRDIRIIDPACGSGHFLLYCFDVLEEIYLEAYADEKSPLFSGTGRTIAQDFPDQNEFLRQIPGLILRYNLFGIDIDLRSIQIAGLALWLRAQRYYRDRRIPRDSRPKISRANLVCAEPMPGEEDFLKDFSSQLNPPLLGHLVTTVFKDMRLADEVGSLLKIDEQIAAIVRKVREGSPHKPLRQLLITDDRYSLSEQLSLYDVSGISDGQFWEQVDDRVSQALREYAEKATNGKAFSRRLFAEDAVQGFAFVDVMMRNYDVVLMNPPFGVCSRKAKSYVDTNYPNSRQDLACAFVERWLDKLEPDGRLGAITTRTPFFLSSCTRWRERVVLGKGSLEIFADFGYGVLDAMVETAAYVLTKARSESKAVFLRLLKDEDKGGALASTLANPAKPRWFNVDPASFLSVPTSPFCYWASQPIRTLFKAFRPFERGEQTAKMGLTTGDDFRFVRAWWEVLPDSEARSREETLSGRKKWVPFAKGGAYSPYYADVHLVVNWANDGEEIRASDGAFIRNEDFQFNPGLTWSRRTTSRLSVRAMPKGCIFADKGPAAFGPQLEVLLGLLNSSVFELLTSIRLGAATAAARSYEIGIIQTTPVPENLPLDLGKAAAHCLRLKRELGVSDEANRSFIVPTLLRLEHTVEGMTLAELHSRWIAYDMSVAQQLADCQAVIDKTVFSQYGLMPGDIRCEDVDSGPSHGSIRDSTEQDEDESDGLITRDLSQSVQALLSWCVGVVFGRFDICLATGDRPIPDLGDPFDPLPKYSPGMLLEVPPDYPILIDEDGVLVDDDGHSEDIIRRVREVLALLWDDRAGDIEQEMCSILNVSRLRDYFNTPGQGGFFDFHIKQYSKSRRKAPIYWLLQSSKRSYGVWLYYPRLDSDTLFKVLERYIRPRINRQENLVEELTSHLRSMDSGLEKRRLENEMEKQANLLRELEDFRDRVKEAAELYLKPDLDDGVILNMAPLHQVIPWDEPRKYWEELLDGKYRWSSIGKQLSRRR